MIRLFKIYFNTLFVSSSLALSFITMFFSLFLAAMLIDRGMSQSSIALHYMMVFLIPFILIKLSANTRSHVLIFGFLGLIPIVYIFLESGQTTVYTYILCLISGIAITTRDQVMQFHHQALLDTSLKHKVSFQSLNTVSIFVMTATSLGFSFVLSFFIADHTLFWVTFLMVWCFSFANFFMASAKIRPQETSSSHEDTKDFPSTKIPLSVTAQCLYTTLVGMSYYTGKFFILPYLILESAKRFGLENYSFPLIASIIGLISIAGMLGRFYFKPSDLDNQKLMKYGYRFDIAFWLAIFLSGYFISAYNLMHPAPYLVVIVAFIGREITSKFWTVGFFGVLNEQVNHYQSITPHPRLYKHFMAQYSSLKSLGGVMGFGWIYLTSSVFTIYLSVAIFCIVSLVYDLVVSNSTLPVVGKKQSDSGTEVITRLHSGRVA